MNATDTRVNHRKMQAAAMAAQSMAGTGSQAAGMNPALFNKDFSGPQSTTTMKQAPTPSLPHFNPQQVQRTQLPQQPQQQGNPQLGAFLQAISRQESNGNYGAVGVPTKYGTALGKYQVLDSNIEGPAGWDQEALGKNITASEFLHSPEYQEQIARAKLSTYFKEYGAAGAAKAWYAGPGNADSMSTSPQYGGPSIVGYADSVLDHMKEYL